MVVGLNPDTVYWMGLAFFTLICCKNCIFLLQKTKKTKRGRGGHIEIKLHRLTCIVHISIKLLEALTLVSYGHNVWIAVGMIHKFNLEAVG